jgi:membrane-bound serine protease (ClpP class)
MECMVGVRSVTARVIRRLVVVVIVLAGGMSVIAHANSQTVAYQLDIRDDIKAGTALDVARAISRAEHNNAEHLIITIDTPGGLLQSTRDIVSSMSRSSVPISVYVDQPSGWAFSAGTIILMAADGAYVHPTASIGAAQPFSPEGGNEIQEEKAQEATAAWIRSLAIEKDRDADIAEKFVTENLVLAGDAALEAGVVDATPVDLTVLAGELGVSVGSIELIEPTLTGRVLNVLSDPFLVSLFLTLGSLALLLAIRSGEFEISGAIGIMLLLIGLWGIGVIEFGFLSVGLLVLGAVLIMIELFDEPGFGIFGVAGIVSIIAGTLTISEEPFFEPQLLSASGIIVIVTLLLALLLFGIISRALARSIRSKPSSGPESLRGRQAVVEEALQPAGRVIVDTESWRARLDDGRQRAKKGETVYIRSTEGNTLVVVKNKEDIK